MSAGRHDQELLAKSSIGTGPLLAGACFVHVQGSAVNFLAIERGHCSIGFGVVAHRDERESTGLARHAIHQKRYFRDLAVFFEKILKIVFGSLKGEISYV